MTITADTSTDADRAAFTARLRRLADLIDADNLPVPLRVEAVHPTEFDAPLLRVHVEAADWDAWSPTGRAFANGWVDDGNGSRWTYQEAQGRLLTGEAFRLTRMFQGDSAVSA